MQPLLKKPKKLPKGFVAWQCFFLYLLLFIFAAPLSFAETEDNASKLIEYLAQERINLSLQAHETALLSPPTHPSDIQTRIAQNTRKQTLNDLKLESLNEFLASQIKSKNNIEQKIKHIQQQTLVKNNLTNTQEKLSGLETLKTVNKKAVELLNETIAMAKAYKKVLQNEKKQLNLWEVKFQLHQQLKKISQREAKTRNSLNQLYQKNIDIQQQGKPDQDKQSALVLEESAWLNNQNITIYQQDLSELASQRKILTSEYLFLQHQNLLALNRVINTYLHSLALYEEVEGTLAHLSTSLNKFSYLASDKLLKKQYQQLKQAISKKQNAIQGQKKALSTGLNTYQQRQKEMFASRQTFANYSFENIPEIFNQLAATPGQLYNYFKALAWKFTNNYAWKTPVSAGLLWALIVMMAIFSILLHRLFNRLLTHNKERLRLTGYLYDGALSLVNRNLFQLTALSVFIAALTINQIPYTNYRLIVNIFCIWLTFRSLIIIAKLSLLESISDSSGKDVKLYYRLKWLLLSGGWVTALMITSHQLHMAIIVQDIFNRLFMLFILAISLVTWRSRDVLPHLLEPYLISKKRYVRNAVSILVLLLPLTLFTTAVIGLLGYINLAWTMSKYQAYTLIMLTGYVLVRGLLFDALELVSEWMIASLRNGWLWIEVLLKPLDKILRILLLSCGIFILFNIFGWISNESIINRMKAIALYPLINVSGIHITLVSIAEFTLLFSIFIWAAKWTREFCYRWLYRNTKDAGIRNSLSVFSQYAVILIGSFIALRVLGLDFSGMSMILGGLAVGMGFGLRDFASNVIGGLMLLIERPVREGDLITLEGYEGRVSHIGIRSMRLSTWDNMEVLIPNAETFNKPFTNWTHQDSVVRTVFPIKVSRADDPLMVQQLILDVLATTAEILTDPPAQVFLKQIDEALIEFEVRYFVNIELHTRVEIRSKVLFAVTAQFKAAGIKPPIPPIHVEFAESESRERLVEKKATEK